MRIRKPSVLTFLFFSIAVVAQQLPASKAHYPIQFLAYGDVRFTDPASGTASNPEYRRAIVAQVTREKPSFVLLTGDLVRNGSSQADWQVWDEETEPWRRAGIRVLPVLGNHDISGDPDAVQYFNHFPELHNQHWYSIRIANCYFIMLESNTISADTAQWSWLLRRLQKVPRGVQYLFIVQHHPLATRSSKAIPGGGHSLRPIDERLALLLEERQKQLKIPIIVLAGHVHNYERYVRGGVTYITTGGGGATPYEIPRRPDDLYQAPGPNYSYCRITVDRKSLKFEMMKVVISGREPSFTVADSFQLERGQAKRLAPSP